MYKRVPKARNIQKVFNEQAVYERDTKIEKGLLDDNGN